MAHALPELERRKRAIEATLAHFSDRPFQWGRVDCAKVAAYHLRQMGHRLSLAKAGPYKTALGARRALARSGHDSLKGALATIGLLEIPASAALIGDLMIHDAQMDGFEAAQIIVGGGAVYGFVDGAMERGLHPIRLTINGRAFRV